MDQVWDATPVGMPNVEAANAAKAKARQALIEALTKSLVQDMYDDGAYPYEIARMGHIGFNYRTNLQLAQEAVDRGLDERHPGVAEAIAVLEA